MKNLLTPILGGLCALSILYSIHLQDKNQMLEADLEQTYFELNGAQDTLDSLYSVIIEFEDSERFAEKASDVIRCSMDNGDTTVTKVMRDMVPEIEDYLSEYTYCY